MGRLYRRLHQKALVTGVTVREVNESFSSIACRCGAYLRSLGFSKDVECVDEHCALHGVTFQRDERSTGNIALLNAPNVLTVQPVAAVRVAPAAPAAAAAGSASDRHC